MSKTLKNLLALALGLLVALGLGELALRLAGFESPRFFVPDPVTGVRHRPGATGRWTSEGNAAIRINGAGFRDREFDRAKTPDAFRIVVLGDSFTEALQVAAEDSFPRLLEARLAGCEAFAGRRVETRNFGVSGFGTTQSWLNYQAHASAYEPDLVLLAFTPINDVRNNSRELERGKMRPFAIATAAGLEIDTSFHESPAYRLGTGPAHRIFYALADVRLAQAVGHLVRSRRQARAVREARRENHWAIELGLHDQALIPPATPDWERAWDLTEQILAALAEAVEKDGAELFLTSASWGTQVDPDPAARRAVAERLGVSDLFYAERRLAEIAARLGLPFLALGPPMAAAALRTGTHFHGFANTRPGTGHWNEAGHRLAGELLGAALCERRAGAPR